MIEFRDFYKAIHGYAPFNWQEFVANRILANGWPSREVLDPPTASGKTSMIDIAVYVLAAQHGLPALERSAPLRTFFVTDRRLVVDDVTRHGLKILEAIEQRPELRDICERLRSFGGSRPIEITTLRGGMYHDETWADLPNQPLICVSTVDQVGSRLLFRGYGLNERRRPIDAGLLGCDSLFIVDEAHLSTPFLQTLEWVQKYARWAERPPAPPPRVIEMTATPQRESGFALPADVYERDEKLGPRLNAEKRTELRETANIVVEASVEAMRMMSRPNVNVVGIVVNRVDTARAIFQGIRDNLCDNEDGAVLLTGRIRPFDRDRLIETFLDRMRAGRDPTLSPLFVVATQTIEVGADLDFDALISEAAPLDALRQRFGRLNRLGNQPASSALILKRSRKKGEADSIYGDALDKAWEWLNRHAERNVIDFGALRMKALYKSDEKANVNSGAKNGPIMFPAHVESLVQTNPAPEPDPDIGPFLHGLERDAPDVNIVWRADLSDDAKDWRNVVEAAPPLSAEALPVPIWAAKKWLSQEKTTELADVDTCGEANEEFTRPHVIWRGPEDSGLGRLRPGDTVVVRSMEGGSDRFGWFPDCADTVKDIGDDSANERARLGSGRYRVRLHPAVFAPNDDESTARLQRLLAAVKEDESDAEEELIELARQRFPVAKDWRLTRYDGGLCAISKWPKANKADKQPLPASEDSNDDDSASFGAGEIELHRHVRHVVNKVEIVTENCGLDEKLRKALIEAAEFHDLGKWDSRFQEMLNPGRDPYKPPLAKSSGSGSPAERRRRREYAGYPAGARHEVLVGCTDRRR